MCADTRERVERIRVGHNEKERERERRAVVNTNIEFSRTLRLKLREAAALLLSEYMCRVFPLLHLLANEQLLSHMLYIICLVKVKKLLQLFDSFFPLITSFKY
jgi:hypothetical protein